MNKFSITKLESARRSPVDFAKSLKDGVTDGGFGRYPKSMRWLNAICKYHENNDIAEAFTSIEKGFSNRKPTAKNRKELEVFIEALANYEEGISKLKYSLIKSRESIEINLSSILKISGMIPLIFMKPVAGFAAFFITKENPTWESELKYPILQNYIAETIFDSDVNTIDIGYIDFYTGEFHQACYSNSEIKSATKELNDIGRIMSLHL